MKTNLEITGKFKSSNDAGYEFRILDDQSSLMFDKKQIIDLKIVSKSQLDLFLFRNKKKIRTLKEGKKIYIGINVINYLIDSYERKIKELKDRLEKQYKNLQS